MFSRSIQLRRRSFLACSWCYLLLCWILIKGRLSIRFLRVLLLTESVSWVFPFTLLADSLGSWTSESWRSVLNNMLDCFKRGWRIQNWCDNLRTSACIYKIRHTSFETLRWIHKCSWLHSLICHILRYFIQNPSVTRPNLRIHAPLGTWLFTSPLCC